MDVIFNILMWNKMKQKFLAALLSGLVVPGLGQIINQQTKKGIALLVIVFILFIAGTIQFAIILSSSVLGGQITNPLDTSAALETLQDKDLTALWIILSLFGIVWLFAVVDAFIGGKKKREQGPEPEIQN